MRRIANGSKWKEELKLDIYRDCFQALDEHQKTKLCFIQCLEKRSIELVPRTGAYVRKSKNESPYVVHLTKNGVGFALSDMPFPKWPGWVLVAKLGEKIGDQLSDAGVEISSEKSSIGDYGFDTDVFNSVMRLPSVSLLQSLGGRVTKMEYSQVQHCMIRTESALENGSPQKELQFVFAGGAR